MMEIDVDVDGEILNFGCPVCQEDHDGLIVIRLNGDCPLCKGEGSIERPAFGAITVTIEPDDLNEGWL